MDNIIIWLEEAAKYTVTSRWEALALFGEAINEFFLFLRQCINKQAITSWAWIPILINSAMSNFCTGLLGYIVYAIKEQIEGIVPMIILVFLCDVALSTIPSHWMELLVRCIVFGMLLWFNNWRQS